MNDAQRETAPVQGPAWPAGIRAVLLDMDGTLVDSDAAVERAWRVWAAEYGVAVEAVLEVMHGSPADRTVRTLLPDLDDAGAAAAAARQLELQYTDLSDVVPAPGARPLLTLIGRLGLPWAVVTSADDTLARARLGAAGVTPPLLITREDVRKGKPDPEGYLLAATRLGVPPGRCLVVEDSVPGIEAGRRAGARVAALRGLPADLTLHDLGELTTLLATHLPGGHRGLVAEPDADPDGRVDAGADGDAAPRRPPRPFEAMDVRRAR